MINRICEWEKRYKLFEKGRLDGFDFYSYLRRELVNTAVNSKNGVKTDPFEGKGQKDTGLKLFFKLLKHSHKTKMRDVDILILCHSRRQKAGEVYESVFTDFLEEEFPKSLTLERLFDDHTHFEPAKTKNLCYTDDLTLKGYIYRLYKKKFCPREYESLRLQVKDIMEAPLRALEESERIDLKKDKYYDRAVTLYYFRKIKRPEYEKFLNLVRPRVLTEVVSKSVDAMILNELCKERNIPVIELQHSLLGPIAKYPDGIKEKQSPDYYLSYSDYWSEYQTYPIKKENVFSCGSPYFERQVKEYKKKSRVEKFDGDVINVLFISGAAYGPQLSKVAIDLAWEAADTEGKKIRIIYKLHPDEFGNWKEEYPELLHEAEKNDTMISVIDSKDVSIYEFFDDAAAQVGVFSTALYEGLAFELSTFILDIPFAGEFIDFCREGNGTLIKDGAELYAGLMDMSQTAAPQNVEKFWKSGARENIVARINEIIEKR